MIDLNVVFILLVISILGNIISSHIVPLEWIKDKLGIGQKRKTYSRLFIIDTIIFTIWKLFNCSNCLSFWLTVIYFYPSYEGLYLGLISYALSAWIENNVFTTKITF